MKALLQTLVCCLIFVQLHAQDDTHSNTIKTKNEWTTFKAADQKSAINLMQDKATLKLAQDDRLTLFSTKDDALGYRHSRYQQTYKDVPIEGAVYLMHEKNNRVQHTNGKLVRDLDMSITPTLPESTALQSALKHINATLYAWNDPTHENLKKQVEACEDATFYPSGDLVIIDPKFGEKAELYRLAYKFDIYAVEPLTRSAVYVDAHTGAILTTIEKIHDCTGISNASGATNYSGNRSFTACQGGGIHTLANGIGSGMQVFNSNNTQGHPQIHVTDPDGFFEGDPTANEVHWATEKTYEYFLNIHGRNSLDDQGMPLYSWVHFRNNFNNAFWDGSVMTYGDGDGNVFSSLTAPDVVAHEMAHGITQFSAGLIYAAESGALNESFSDIFGEVVERHIYGSNDWIIGADFTVQPGKNGIRNMSNPNDATMLTQQPDTRDGTFWRDVSGSCHQGNDYCGVHFNSGVQNYWFYLLCEGGSGVNDKDDTYSVSGIGMDKAAAIAYLTLTDHLTSTSGYTDARNGSINAAEELQEAGILTVSDVQQVEAAWCAVNVGNGCNNTPPPPSSTCNRQIDSLALVDLYNSTNGTSWTNSWNLNQAMDNWEGVTLSEGCVVELELSSNQLNGNIPSTIGNMTNLTYLRLNNNALNGSIPPTIGNLTNLTFLWISNNDLSGNIPIEITSLNNLTVLRLNANNLTGTIPPEIGNLVNLTDLHLSANSQLGGNIPIEIGNLTNLTKLRLNSNNHIGTIPTIIGNLTNLTDLRLYANNLSGNIPAEIGNLTNLTLLYLYNNQLSGCYDSNLINLCGQLDIDENINANISDDNSFDAPWEDFCLNGIGSCNNVVVTPVFPGDFNNDGIVNHVDLIQWGLAEGITGTIRPNASLNWTAQDCPEWQLYISGINAKHCDGDGSGTVGINDIQTLIDNYNNYNNTHTATPSYTESPFKFRLVPVSSTTQNGTISTVYDLYVESSLGIPVSVHGLAIRIGFGSMPVLSANFDFTNSALVPDQHFQQFDASQNAIDIALTRTDKSNQSCTSPIARGVVVTDDWQVGNPFTFTSNGKTMSANGILTDVSGSAQFGFLPEVGVYGNFSASISATYSQCNDAGEATAEPFGGTTPYTYAWSTGETTKEVNNLPVGAHSVTVTEANGLSQVIDFETQWAFTPVEVTTNSTQICINFDNAPLAESVQVSLDNGATYESPITANTCYNVATGTHHVWIQRVADQCPVDLGTVTISSGGGGCNSRVVDANLTAIGGEFGQFANEEFIKNFLTAEKGYIRYQAEIHRILESKEARYTQVNQDFGKIKDMAMTMLFQSFVSKHPVTVTDEHIKAIDNFLVSLSQATSKGKLRNEITKVRQHLHVMESKEVKDALTAFDRAGAVDTSGITPFDTPDQDQFDVQLLNTAGSESRVTYNIVKQGILNMNLYNTHGQQVMTLHNGISYEGHHQIPIDKSGLPPGIYFIHIEYIADGVPINKILKMAVMK